MRFEEKLQLREERGFEKGFKQGKDIAKFEFLEEAFASGDKDQLNIVLKVLEMTSEEAISFCNAYKEANHLKKQKGCYSGEREGVVSTHEEREKSSSEGEGQGV